MENLGLGSPNVASPFPLPVTRRTLARFNKSANGTPAAESFSFRKTLPSRSVSSSDLRFSNGDPGVLVAMPSSAAIA